MFPKYIVRSAFLCAAVILSIPAFAQTPASDGTSSTGRTDRISSTDDIIPNGGAVSVQAFPSENSSRLSLNWHAPVGWQIKTPQDNQHQIIFYTDQALDLSRVNLALLPQVRDIHQQSADGKLVLSITTSSGSNINVSWQDGKSIVDVTNIQPTNLLYGQLREQAKAAPVKSSPVKSNSVRASSTSPQTQVEAIAPPPPQLQTQPTEEPPLAIDYDFEGALDQTLPLSPEQIVRFSDAVKKTEDAIQQGAGPAPSAVVRALPLSLEANAAVEVISLAKNHITTLVFLDATGQAWPINHVALGEAFTLVGFSEQRASQTYDLEGAHELRLIPKTALPFGNISISLKGLATPVVLKLVSNRQRADYRVDVRLADYGPNAQKPIIDIPDEIASVNSASLAFLSGVPPTGARLLKVSGALSTTKAWEHQGQYWLKTKSAILSPAYNRRLGSIDGTFVYTLKKSPVVIVSDKGQPRNLQLAEIPVTKAEKP